MWKLPCENLVKLPVQSKKFDKYIHNWWTSTKKSNIWLTVDEFPSFRRATGLYKINNQPITAQRVIIASCYNICIYTWNLMEILFEVSTFLVWVSASFPPLLLSDMPAIWKLSSLQHDRNQKGELTHGFINSLKIQGVMPKDQWGFFLQWYKKKKRERKRFLITVILPCKSSFHKGNPIK